MMMIMSSGSLGVGVAGAVWGSKSTKIEHRRCSLWPSHTVGLPTLTFSWPLWTLAVKCIAWFASVVWYMTWMFESRIAVKMKRIQTLIVVIGEVRLSSSCLVLDSLLDLATSGVFLTSSTKMAEVDPYLLKPLSVKNVWSLPIKRAAMSLTW